MGNTIIKQHREPTDSDSKLITTIRLGPHTIQAIDWEGNHDYYLRVNGHDVPLRMFRRAKP